MKTRNTSKIFHFINGKNTVISITKKVNSKCSKILFLAVSLLLFSLIPNKIFTQNFALEIQPIPLKFNDLKNQLLNAPMENERADTPFNIEIPFVENKIEIEVWESPLLAQDFALEYPGIKTFAFRGANDPFITGRMTLTPTWVNIFIISNQGSMVIRPENISDPINYILEPEFAENLTDPPSNCEFQNEITQRDGEQIEVLNEQLNSRSVLTFSNGNTRRNYNLALVLTGEFHDANGGNIPSAIAVATTAVNNIQAIYDRELAIRFVLQMPFVYTDSTTDPFTPDTNVGANSRTVQAADAIATNFASGQYDVGHVFHNTSLTAGYTGGGVAGIGVVCNNGGCTNCTGGLQKGRGWTGRGSNVGAGFARLGAHEFGHQFGANHTFNGSGGSCTLANISNNTSYEIGSGTTIMSYRNICSTAQNIPNSPGNADDYFHTHSLTEIVNYINGGGNCAATVATGNTPPVVDANPMAVTYNIPVGTPFTLTGSGNDADGDAIMYCWEQYDEDGNGATPTQGFIGNMASNSSIAPLFRSFPPNNSPSRTFPQLSAILNNSNIATFEALPQVNRNIVFRLTGRDNNPSGGGIHCSTTTVIAVDNDGSFEVGSQNSPLTWNPTIDNTKTVIWDVAGTTDPPINCPNVNILLSLDGGQTFSIVLENSTANDGSEVVTLPNVGSCIARIRVECANNIFFDINDSDIVIDSEAPSITTQASDRTVECDGMGNFNGPLGLNTWLADNGNAMAVDNCDPFVSWSNMLIDTDISCGGTLTYTYRFTAEDNAGNTASTEADFEIVDTTPPDVFCPADITIDCNESDDPMNTGMATATDICGPAPTINYMDVLVDGNCNWECTFDRTWTAIDDCGNMNNCIQSITSSPLGLIQDALSMGPIVIGLPGVSLTLTFDDAECIVEWLSDGFGNAEPSAIPWGNHVNDDISCIPGPIDINPDGTMANPFLAAQIFMAINLRLDPMLGDILLNNTGVSVHMVVINSLPRNPDISDLFRLNNIALGNIFAPQLSFLTETTQGINDAFSFCNGGVGPIIGSMELNTGNISEQAENQLLNNFNDDFSIFPNPANHEVYFDLSAYSGKSLIVEIYNLQGQLILDKKIEKMYDAPLLFKLENFKDAIYLGVIHTEGNQSKSKKFLVKK